MKVAVEETKPVDKKTALLVIPAFEDEKPAGALADVDAALKGEFSELVKKKEFTGKKGEATGVRAYGRAAPEKILFLGLGKRADYAADHVLELAGRAARLAQDKHADAAIHVPLPKGAAALDAGRLAAIGAGLAAYAFEKYVGPERTKDKKKLERVTLLFDRGHGRAAEEGARVGSVLAEATNRARDLANEPANVATPEWVANEARKLAKEKGLKIKVFGNKELRAMGANAILAVNGGSGKEARLVVMEYHASKTAPWIALVGKGITFDSGGISIKPSDDMDKMKYDKSGACAAIAAMAALKDLGVKVNVVGITPLTENLPGENAYRPGDVIKTMSGKTIEVLNTDAEGRVVLADALHYATKYKPKAILDAATLTGACWVALGDVCAGLVGNNADVVKDVKDAARDVGEKVWELPLYPEYEERIKGAFGDVKNIGDPGAGGGAITAAAFLKNFVGDTPWAHLDIAGTAWRTNPKNTIFSDGQTGAATRLFLAYALRHGKKR